MTREYMLRLPWPDRMLSPNASNGHKVLRMKAHKAKKAARADTWALACEQGVSGADWSCGAVLRFFFYPPDRRRRDVQNMPHMMKGQIDGIADALGCDDSLFRVYWPPAFDEPVAGGAVIVRIEPIGDGSQQIPIRGEIK